MAYIGETNTTTFTLLNNMVKMAIVVLRWYNLFSMKTYSTTDLFYSIGREFQF